MDAKTLTVAFLVVSMAVVHQSKFSQRFFDFLSSPFLSLRIVCLADGLKCYKCISCGYLYGQSTGREQTCEPWQDACLKTVVNPDHSDLLQTNKDCTSKNMTTVEGCATVLTLTTCRCDTDLCNGSVYLETKPIFLAISALTAIFTFF